MWPLSEPLGEAGERRLQKLEGALHSARHGRREGDPEEVERGRERHDVEVPGRRTRPEDAATTGFLMRVQLHREDTLRVPEGVPGGAVHVRQRPKRQGILRFRAGPFQR